MEIDKQMKINIPLMENNIIREDLDFLIEFLKTDAILTQSKQVKNFEETWSKWLGVKNSVFVNSGASANLITMAALKYLYGECEIIVPTLTWVSDIASVIQNGHYPIFVDIDLSHLGMLEKEVINKITPKTKAVFLTNILGFNALSENLLVELHKRNILLIEDVCESHGATHAGKKLGSIGYVSNFSFYYAHHMSTIEGGMVCTNDNNLYQVIRMLRSHGMTREVTDENFKNEFSQKHPDLNPQFIFAMPAYNVRSTELNAVLGLNQIKRLDSNNRIRTENLKLFLENLDGKRYFKNFKTEGSSNYAFILLLNDKDDVLRDKIMKALDLANVEYRRGTSGGGNQLRQPYLKKLYNIDPTQFPNIDHVHFYGFYIGNYPSLEKNKILQLCELLNKV